MDELKRISERFWNDVAGLPWKDKAWVKNPELVEQTRQHYVNATYEDLKGIFFQHSLKQVLEQLDARMVEKPSRELADTSNFLQALVEEEPDATVTSKDS